MLLRHSVLYLLARGLPGIVNFLAIPVYTRLLTPAAYGQYALVVSGIGFLNVLFFQWLRVSLLRFFPSHEQNPRPLLSVILFGFLVLVVLTGGIGAALGVLLPDPVWRPFLLVGLLMLWTHAWFELNLELARSRLEPLRYGLLSGSKAIMALVLGVGCVFLGLGSYGPLVGLLVATAVVGIAGSRGTFAGIRPGYHREQFGELLRYGLPLTGTFVLGFIINASDRFLIAGLLGEASAGQYSAAHDLAQQTLTLLMVVVNLAAYPLAVKALESEGREAAERQLRNNAVVLLGVALPAALGMWLLASNIVVVLLGTEFATLAVDLLPAITLAALLAGIKAYYFDQAFQLGRWTMGQVWVLVASAATNVILNLLWISPFGVQGAAWATVISYALGLILSVILGRRVFPVPFPWAEVGRVLLASLVMGAVLLPLRQNTGFFALVVQVGTGALAYFATVLLLNVAGVRDFVISFVRRRSQWGV